MASVHRAIFLLGNAIVYVYIYIYIYIHMKDIQKLQIYRPSGRYVSNILLRFNAGEQIILPNVVFLTAHSLTHTANAKVHSLAKPAWKGPVI